MLVDAHAHIDRYERVSPAALKEALREIEDHQILTLSNSMDLPSYERNSAIARDCRLILPSFGVHPWMAPDYADRLGEFGDAIDSSPLLGETGLDFHFVEDKTRYPAQIDVLRYFLAAARAQDKIITVHTKGAEAEVLGLMMEYAPLRAIVHWYSGPLDTLNAYIAQDCYFTVGFEVCRSAHIQAIARRIPLDRLLTETDNPGGSGSLLGRPGTPVLVREVVAGLARCLNRTSAEIVAVVGENLLRLFAKDRRLAEVVTRLEQETDP